MVDIFSEGSSRIDRYGGAVSPLDINQGNGL